MGWFPPMNEDKKVLKTPDWVVYLLVFVVVGCILVAVTQELL